MVNNFAITPLYPEFKKKQDLLNTNNGIFSCLHFIFNIGHFIWIAYVLYLKFAM